MLNPSAVISKFEINDYTQKKEYISIIDYVICRYSHIIKYVFLQLFGDHY